MTSTTYTGPAGGSAPDAVPATMRAIRLHEWNAVPLLEEVETPRPAAGESLVKVEAAALGHLDLTVARGTFGIRPDLPYTPGVEGAGVVVESDTLPAGSSVMLRGAGLGLVRPGTWAEYVTVPSASLAPSAEGLSADLAATFVMPTTTALYALHRIGQLGAWRPGAIERAEDEVVLVTGAAGAVGSSAVQLAVRAGSTVLALVSDPSRAGLVPPGAEVVTTQETARLARLGDERPVTMLIDTVGGPDLGARARWVRPGGRAVLIGYTGGTDVSLFLPNWLLDDVSLLSVNMIRREQEAAAEASELAALLVSGELRLGVQRFAFGEIGEALELLRTGKLRGGRAVIRPDLG